MWQASLAEVSVAREEQELVPRGTLHMGLDQKQQVSLDSGKTDLPNWQTLVEHVLAPHACTESLRR